MYSVHRTTCTFDYVGSDSAVDRWHCCKKCRSTCRSRVHSCRESSLDFMSRRSRSRAERKRDNTRYGLFIDTLCVNINIPARGFINIEAMMSVAVLCRCRRATRNSLRLRDLVVIDRQPRSRLLYTTRGELIARSGRLLTRHNDIRLLCSYNIVCINECSAPFYTVTETVNFLVYANL